MTLRYIDRYPNRCNHFGFRGLGKFQSAVKNLSCIKVYHKIGGIMGRYIALGIVGLILVIGVACGGGEETTTTATNLTSTEPTSVPPTPVPPTEVPAPEPTEVPLTPVPPTEVPAPEPTEVPAPEPTEVPAPEPTAVPAPEPTAVPTPEPTPEPTAVPLPVPNVSLAILEGSVEVKAANSDEWQRGVHGQGIDIDEHVRTLDDSTAILNFIDGSSVKLKNNTELVIEVFDLVDGGPPEGSRVARIAIVSGDINFDVTDLPSPPNVWQFATGGEVISVQGE